MKKEKRRTLIVTACVLSAVLLALILIDVSDGRIHSVGEMGDINTPVRENSYSEYVKQHPGTYVGEDLVFDAVDTVKDPAAAAVSDGEDRCLLLPDTGTVSFILSVETAGRYCIGFTYRSAEGSGGNIYRNLYVNGSVPYSEASGLTFFRSWSDKTEIATDIYGNDIRPLQIENPRWETVYCRDCEGYVSEPLTIYLDSGENEISLEAEREPMMLGKIILSAPEKEDSYDALKEKYAADGYRATAGVYLQIEGESAEYKSSPTVYPITDTSTCSTEPYIPSVIKLNSIGGTRWSYVGNYIEWKFTVPESGLYNIAVKARQNVTSGLVSSRRIYVDGKVPFSELESFSFFYDSAWQSVVLGNGKESYAFYLEKDTPHTLRMEVTLGEMGKILGVAREVLKELNTIYREIIIVTGTSPDKMRDYRFDEILPDTVVNIGRQCEVLKSICSALETYNGRKNGNAAILGTLIRQLGIMNSEPDEIADNLSYFKTNIGSLGTWINDMSSLNLEIDYISVYSPDVKLKKPNASFFRSLTYQTRRFFDAFILDYNRIGTVTETDEDKTITIWSSAGRDQMQTLKVMLNDSFTQETGVGVNLELVEDRALLTATVAGIGPDVAMGVGQSLPVDYALRNAVAPMENFDTFKTVLKRFPATLVSPYVLNGSTYALPESISFPVLYYRTDILESLGVEIPQTWNDVIALTTVLSNNNISFGFPYSTTADPGGGLSLFYSLLMQRGGVVYSDDKTACLLDSDISVEAFKQWTNLYINYGQPLEVNFVNRFRTGEIPLGIAGQGVYNTLVVSAPEIKGLWGFTVIPGTQKDSEIDRTCLVGSNCCVILAASSKKEQAWDYVDWWTRDDVQLRFGREMESVLGASARYPTANVKAYESLAWTKSEWETLSASINNGRAVPEVPGGYYVPRHINNAFRAVVLQSADVKDTLLDYVESINIEMLKKREEFGFIAG